MSNILYRGFSAKLLCATELRACTKQVQFRCAVAMTWLGLVAHCGGHSQREALAQSQRTAERQSAAGPDSQTQLPRELLDSGTPVDAPLLDAPESFVGEPVDGVASAALPSAEDERLAYERARPVLERYCASCHRSSAQNARSSSLRHFSMDRYPFGGHHANTIGTTILFVLGVTRPRPSMPMDQPGAVVGEELRAVTDWALLVQRRQATVQTDGGLSRQVRRAHQHD
jgi:hypothetical protein